MNTLPTRNNVCVIAHYDNGLSHHKHSLPVNLIAVTMSTCVKTKAGVLFAFVRYKLSIFAAAQEIKQTQSIYVVL